MGNFMAAPPCYLQIRHEDIAEGCISFHDEQGCAITTAICRQIPGVEFVDVNPEHILFYLQGNPYAYIYPTPQSVRDFLGAFYKDQWENLHPFTVGLRRGRCIDLKGEPL